MGFGAMLGAILGSSGFSEETEAAMRELAQEATKTSKRAREVEAELTPIGTEFLTGDPLERFTPETRRLREGLIAETFGGLSTLAELQFEDLDRLLTERAVATGNLRSSNIQFGRAELGRRIAADELQRAIGLVDLFGRQDIAARTLGVNVLNVSQGFLGVAPRAVQAGAVAGSVAQRAEAARIADERATGAAIGSLFDIGLGFGVGGFAGATGATIPGSTVETGAMFGKHFFGNA